MRTAKLIAALCAAGLLAACAEDPPEPASTAVTETVAGTGQPDPNTIAYFNQVVGDRVFFATDRSSLDAEAQRTLGQQAQWLLANPGFIATIEGHADERGTRAYNLALGARRSESAFRFLVSQGVPANRLKTVTFGKERPVARCSNESCWSQNRRSVTVVASPAS